MPRDQDLKQKIETYRSASSAFVKIANADLLPQHKSESLTIPHGPPHNTVVKFDGSTELHGHNNGHSQSTGLQIKRRIAAVREAYDNSEIIGNAIDLMVDFALEGFDIIHENKPIQRFFKAWKSRVDLNTVAEQILKGYFRDGNVPILTYRGKIKPREFTKLKKAVAKFGKTEAQNKDLFVSERPENRVIPYAYHVIDVLNLEKKGSEFVGSIQYGYRISKEDWDLIKRPKSSEDKEAVKRLKVVIGNKNFEFLKQTGMLAIDPERLDIIYYKKDSYKTWANPMLWRVIQHVQYKKLLRDMDVSVVESVTNAITIFKLGDTAGGFPAPPEMYTKFGNLLRTATKSKTLVWNDLIDVIAEYPPIEKILGKEKYQQADADIRSGLGISENVLNGEGGNFANSFVSVKTLSERLEGGRQALLEWLNSEMIMISKAMNFDKPPWIKMRHMSLRDEAAEKQLILELVDRGMVSYETCVERFGENFDIEVQRMKEEDSFRKRNEKRFPFTLHKLGKFGPNISGGPISVFDMIDQQTMEAELIKKDPEAFMKPQQPQQATPTSQESNGDKGGKPANKPKKAQKKKETPRNSPVGQKTAASLDFHNMGLQIFDKLYDIIVDSYLKSNSIKNRRNLSNLDKINIYNSIQEIIGYFDTPDQITESNVAQAITDSSSSDQSYIDIKAKINETINELDNKKVSKSKMKEIVALSFSFVKQS